MPFALIAVALLCGPQVVSAAPLSIATMLSNFQFAGDEVDYSPDLKDLVLRWDNSSSAAPATGDAGRDIQIALFVDDDADVLRVAFNTFGSLPPMLRASESELLKDSIQTMEGRSLQFIADTSAVSGPLARRYRAAELYMTVAGLDSRTGCAAMSAPTYRPSTAFSKSRRTWPGANWRQRCLCPPPCSSFWRPCSLC
ncbi:MAG TPA: hypothetical protein VLM84_13025 [Chromatiaceae bacterium]|nr:hypothetical protein [Chromatiaceae bacterium]